MFFICSYLKSILTKLKIFCAECKEKGLVLCNKTNPTRQGISILSKESQINFLFNPSHKTVKLQGLTSYLTSNTEQQCVTSFFLLSFFHVNITYNSRAQVRMALLLPPNTQLPFELARGWHTAQHAEIDLQCLKDHALSLSFPPPYLIWKNSCCIAKVCLSEVLTKMVSYQRALMLVKSNYP